MNKYVLVAGLMLAACDSESAGDTVGTEISKDYNEMLEEAAAVEDTAEAAKTRVDAALDEADGNARD